jgi:hypothetical protein
MGIKKYVILLGSIAMLSACTEVQPTFDRMGVNLSQPKFSGLNSKSFPIATYNSALTVSGECDVRILKLEWSADGGVTWRDSGSPERDCADKNFQFTVSNAADFGFSSSHLAGHQIVVLLRGKSVQDFTSESSTMNVRIQNANRSRLAHVSSGGGLMTTGSYRIMSSVGAPIDPQVMSTANYRIQLREGNQ